MPAGPAAPIEFVVPGDSLVLLVGPAGAGKSTFAGRNFPFGSILSSDALRDLLRGDPSDQRATVGAFRLLHAAAEQRLVRGLLTVVDATNVQFAAREPLLELGRAWQRPCVAITFALSLTECLARNAARSDRTVPAAVVRRQHGLFIRARDHLGEEGMAIIRLVGPADVARASIVVGPVGNA